MQGQMRSSTKKVNKKKNDKNETYEFATAS